MTDESSTISTFNRNEYPYANEIQETIAACIENEYFTNELYLQLIKMTLNNPDFESKYELRIWNVFSIMTGVLHPSIKIVFDYLSCHLERFYS